MLGIDGGELVVLAALALVVIGPDRLPDYAVQLGRVVRDARAMAAGTREQLRAEMGPKLDELDWRKLDPRQYDPRRIFREALADTPETDGMRPARSRAAPTGTPPR